MHLPTVTAVAAIKADSITVAAVIAINSYDLAYWVGSFQGFINVMIKVGTIYTAADDKVVVLAAYFQGLTSKDGDDDEVFMGLAT